ncbi:MAG: response regulator transcription factor [Bacteroidota bacterium]
MAETKVLYVEDEPFLGKIVKESLESRDFEVHMIADGGQVMQHFDSQTPDICILDVMLPNVDGFTLGQQIREMHPDMPIIFLTAKVQTDDLVKGFSSGGNDYIKKPFSMEELIVRIDNLLHLTSKDSNPKPRKDRVELGKFVFFPQKYELHLGEEVRKLSHRETQLLSLLVQAPKQPVDRREILKAVWGDDSFFNSRNLDVYITKLRDYLKPDPNVKIVTLKGVGYHFWVE